MTHNIKFFHTEITLLFFMGKRGNVAHLIGCAGYVLYLLLVAQLAHALLDPRSIPRREIRQTQAVTEDNRFIVELYPEATHSHVKSALEREVRSMFTGMDNSREKFLSKMSRSWGHEFKHVFHGVSVKGIPRNILEQLPGVKEVHVDGVKSVRVPPWGLDRIDQGHLPLDGVYSTEFTGSGVNVSINETQLCINLELNHLNQVYIIDTGLDTSHIEFSNTENRTVQNCTLNHPFQIKILFINDVYNQIMTRLATHYRQIMMQQATEHTWRELLEAEPWELLRVSAGIN